MSVKVYVEGGGDNKASKSRCREGFRTFFEKTGLPRGSFSVIACGGRQQTFNAFCTALGEEQTTRLLLVDSEEAVKHQNPWEHVRQRAGDGWERPQGASEDQLHLMVQTMEAWFHADKAALRNYYDQHFRENALKSREDVERIPKDDLNSGLKAATKDCQKSEYSKGGHSFQILAMIDPALVRACSPWCARLLDTLDRVCR